MKKGRSTYTFKINNNLNEINTLLNQFITGNNFVKEEKNGDVYYKSGDAMKGYKYFNYMINGDVLTIYAWLKNFSSDVEIEQDGITSLNMFVMGYKNLLATLFAEIEKLNNVVPNNTSVVNNTNNITGYDPQTGQPIYANANSNVTNGSTMNYNPQTGQPVYTNTGSNVTNGNMMNYNPQTGQPVYNNQNVNTFSNNYQNANVKKQETVCEIGFWISIVGLLGAFMGFAWGAIIYILIFYFASQGLKTRKRNKAIASIVITIASILVVILNLISNH